MPEVDLQALEAWAAALTGPGLLAIGQPLWIAPRMSTFGLVADNNVSFFQSQYTRICKALEHAPYDILVCSGDVHYSRLLHIKTRGQRSIYEVVSSPLVSIPTITSSLLDYLPFGGYAGAPSRQHAIKDTQIPPYPGWNAYYQMGTDCGSVLALLNLKPAGAQVSVELAFIDITKRQPARLVPHTDLGGAQLFPCATSDASCVRTDAFKLSKRLL
jgi:hypothetical protein